MYINNIKTFILFRWSKLLSQLRFWEGVQNLKILNCDILSFEHVHKNLVINYIFDLFYYPYS